MLRRIRSIRLERKYGPSIVVVSGLPRSGTSMMMNMLRAAELPVVTDKIRSADEDNPKGYFEDERVKQLHEAEDKQWLLDCRGKVVKIISSQLRHLPDEHHYRVIFMHRDLDEVMASQNKMLAHRGEAVDDSEDHRQQMIRNYQHHLRVVSVLLQTEPNFDHLDVHYREVIDDPRAHAARVARFLGLKLDLDRMAGAVDGSLYRNRAQGAGSR